MSIADASNLRNRVYSLDDIARIHKNHPSGVMAKRTLDQIENKYGR